MRSLAEIRDEAERECSRDGCQSWPIICLVAMQKALNELRNDIIEELGQKF